MALRLETSSTAQRLDLRAPQAKRKLGSRTLAARSSRFSTESVPEPSPPEATGGPCVDIARPSPSVWWWGRSCGAVRTEARGVGACSGLPW